MPIDLAGALARGATVVTASRRLARTLQAEDADTHRDAGEGAWEPADILPWSTWLVRNLDAQEAGALRGLNARISTYLEDTEAVVVWESIIAAEDEEHALLQRAATARAALEAWILCHDWNILIADLAHCEHEDTRRFAAWAKAYAAQCERRGWIDRARLPGVISAALYDGTVAPPAELVLAGFEGFCPGDLQLIEALEYAGASVGYWQPPAQRTQTALLACTDRHAEMEQAARWVYARLRHDPSARIAIIVPDLSERRADLARIFDAVLRPAAVVAGTWAPPAPFNISLGQTLSATPLIRDALLAFELGREQLAFETTSVLLRSPFLGAAQAERDARALLEVELREAGELEIRLSWLIRLAARSSTCACLRLARALELARSGLTDLSRRLQPSAWAVHLDRFLAALGWPGERTLSGVEYQALMAWRELLVQLARLDRVLPTLGFAEAVVRLNRLARERIFQPQSPTTPVQVLGVLEGAGLEFDALWLMGITDETWPPAPRPNPLLPSALQRRLGMPHASGERELDFAERLTARLLTSAPEAIVSWPEHEADRALRPSPLIARLPQTETLRLADTVDYSRMLYVSAKIERFSDMSGPSLAREAARGGTHVLKLQAACPFRAFAVHRLSARALPVPAAGLSAAERGNLVHQVLYEVWGELRTQTRLAGMSRAERARIVAQHVDAVTAEARSHAPTRWTVHFSRLESRRLERLVQAWLDVELLRPPFEIVAREAQSLVRLGPLTLKTRMDRIDTLADGGTAVVDYKTGRVSSSAWLGARPDEPQLPIYAVHAERDVRAVLFASLRVGKLGYVGLAAEDNLVPGAASEPDWSQRLTEWRETLTNLAHAFQRGEASVAPKQGAQTCRLCHLHSLCRIHELADSGHNGAV